MRTPCTTKRFRRDYGRLKKSGRRNIKKLQIIMEQLIDGVALSILQRDHQLVGEWSHCRDCHIEGDWILIYEISYDEEGSEVVTFHATGSHSDLFE